MKILKNETTDYLAANFTESETLWLISNTYNYEDEIRYGHYIYKYAGLDSTNTTDNPEVNYATVSPTWIRIRPTNYYAMLDGSTATQTENADTIVVDITCENFDSFSLLEVEASTVTIELIVATVTEYTQAFDLQDETEVIDFYTYCFSPFVLTPKLYTDSIPLFSGGILRVTIDNTGSIAKCGRLVFGRSYYVGETGFGANLSLESFSSKQTDEFGNTTLVHRGSVNLDSYEIQIPTNKIPTLKRKAKELDARPILFIMDESIDSNVENLLTYGYWDNFTMMLPNKVKSTISLTIKGII